VRSAAERLLASHRPVLVLGGQVLQSAPSEPAAEVLRQAIENLGIPVYLASGARGLLGAGHPLQLKHKRKEALREADLVLLAGIPCDFRLDYGRQIGRGATFVSVNLNADDLKLNRRPSLAVHADPGRFVRDLSAALGAGAAGPIGAIGALGRDGWVEWLRTLRARDEAREAEIDREAALAGERVNPIRLCREIDRSLAEDSILVADGGDFVATASYTLSPRGPRTWLDPGVFGTLGVGGGFAVGAKLCRPECDVWILYGDGSSAYSLAEFDTFARHGLPIVAVVGNDASWNQIAREQVEILKDDVGTVLARTDYHVVAEGYGGKGLLLRRNSEIGPALAEALRLSRGGAPVLVNAHLDKTEFRKGSISM
jgi:acetolactate synthase-1/2/3 large subunit